MAVDVVLRESVQRRGVGHFHDLLAVGDIAVEHGLLLGQLIVQLFEAGARGVVLVHSGQLELQQLALHVVARGGVGLGEIQRAERLVDAAIQRERGGRGAGLAGHFGGGVAELRVRMHLLHEGGEIVCGVDLFEGRVKRPQRVFHGARARDRQDPVQVLLRFRQASGLELFEGGDIGFGTPTGEAATCGICCAPAAAARKTGIQAGRKVNMETPVIKPSIYRAGRLCRLEGYADPPAVRAGGSWMGGFGYCVREWTLSTANSAFLPWQTTQDSPNFGSVLLTAWPAVFLSSWQPWQAAAIGGVVAVKPPGLATAATAPTLST